MQNLGGSQRVSISAQEFRAKYNSKRECFNFLSVDCKAYLSSFDTVTVYFLKDVISGKKKCKWNYFLMTCVQSSNVIGSPIYSVLSMRVSLCRKFCSKLVLTKKSGLIFLSKRTFTSCHASG